MDARIKELVDLAKKQWGLAEYYLGRYRLFRRIMLDGETLYLLNMEWFPNIYADWTDEENPEGTASIDINIHTKEFQSVIFVQGVTYAENGVVFAYKDIKEVKDWLTAFTGLNIEKDFVCKQTDERRYYFEEQWNGVPLSPSCSINVEFNENGELTFYSQNISVLTNKKELEEEYSLSLDAIEDIAREQVVLANFPEEDGRKIVYGVEETYIRNDDKGKLPFMQQHVGFQKNFNKEIKWQKTKKDCFKRKFLHWEDEVSVEDAYLKVKHPDSLPITDELAEKCIQEVTDFLRMKYPNDSGKWTLTYLSRENSYLHAYLEQSTASTLFPGKLIVFLDTDGEVVNYMNKKELWDELMEAKQEETIERKVSKEEAFDKLKPYFTLTPYYVFDRQDKKWIQCGKLDCDYFVDVESGEISTLDNSFFIN
ncbi:hypothetical protein [Niallia hominis]|uniref:PH domain-containing protein n=1 Tax=Niallia hominis TaxID=3133173 RepID=A0ABV1F0F2_9BACI